MSPGTELHVLFNTGVQVANATARFGDGFAIELKNQTQHTVSGRVLRTHVDDDALLRWGAGKVMQQLIPVIALNGKDFAFSGLTLIGHARIAVIKSCHLLYDLRWSGGSICAPLNSTGMPPSG